MAKIDTEREYLGEVVLSTGDKIKLYVPNVGDISDINMSTMNGMYRLAAVACRLPIDEFKRLSMIDATIICDRLADALNTLSPKARTRRHE